MVLPASTPVEYLVEQVAEPTEGEAGLYGAARRGHRLLRLLGSAGLGAARSPLVDAFPLAPAERPLAVTGLMAQTAAMLSRRSLDGAGVLAADDQRLRDVLGTQLDAIQVDDTLEIVGRWRGWCFACGALHAGAGWDDERLEYSFNVTAGIGTQTLTLEAPEHTGGDVDWFSFDFAASAALGAPPPSTPRVPLPPPLVGDVRTVSALPSPVRYTGQPAPRWWEFEDAATNFADIDAGPADLARLLVTEFAVAFSGDWFVVPRVCRWARRRTCRSSPSSTTSAI